MFYAGDGVSDLSAARETDLLFAKKGRGAFAPAAEERDDPPIGRGTLLGDIWPGAGVGQRGGKG